MSHGARTAGEQETGDVLVIFGITGDLAKVMTFRSLYRLEQRGLLDCPIVGVAADDWTVDHLVEGARTSIVGTGEQLDTEVFERSAGRLSYVQGDFPSSIRPRPPTSTRRVPGGRLPAMRWSRNTAAGAARGFDEREVEQ
jgi:hypothetical protein